MKKIISILIALTLLFSLCSCGKYASSYSALGLVRSNTSHSCRASFAYLKGRLVFKLKTPDSGKESDIGYFVTAEEGEIVLYYDIYGTKQELARIGEGETVDARGGYVEGGHTVYIIIEAPNKARGSVSVELDSTQNAR